MSINQDSAIGVAERHDDLRLLVDSEDPSQSENNNAVRRIQFKKNNSIETVPRVANQTVQGKLPFQLQQLCASPGCNITKEERQRIADLLIRHAKAFSKDEYDLGMTPLAEHVIESGDAKHVRCPPWRAPIVSAEEEGQDIETMERQRQGIIRGLIIK